ncbi:MAG: EFR1 family ferrodoxin [Spirochaetia bacterium]|jgi:ferredoxin|nr:EFR1 family ferrodoxin [Spirochaetia bacterium]
MDAKTISLLYFSPTKTTREIVQAIGKGSGLQILQDIDLTAPQVRESVIELKADIVIIGIPVYAFTIPSTVYPCLNQLEGKGKPVILVTVYGNMSAGHALTNLASLCTARHFMVTGGGIFIGRHSFSSPQAPLASDRPDKKDLQIAEKFGKDIVHKLVQPGPILPLTFADSKYSKKAMTNPTHLARIVAGPSKFDPTLCTGCLSCVRNCPAGAIDKKTMQTNAATCIRCYACVTTCPTKARTVSLRFRPVLHAVFYMKNKAHPMPQLYL